MEVENLEGTTAAGKTTVGAFKWMLKVADSDRKLHVLSGLDLGTIEKNIIQAELGILDLLGKYITYHSSGNKEHSMPHMKYQTSKGEKVIYVLGYDNKARWKKALGGQYGCLFIDEVNIADMEYVREIWMRCDYVMTTSNPDDPELPIYHEYINHSRPLGQFKDDAPQQITDQLNQQPKDGWVHWFFDFSHNDGLSKEKIEKIISSVPKGTKLYKNKIQGLRGRAEGLVFSNFEYAQNVITENEARKKQYDYFSCGVDTAYSTKSEDSVSFIYQGITRDGELIILEEQIYNNKESKEPFSPSDIAQNLFDFLTHCSKKWGLTRKVYVDSADQATIMELNKLKRKQPVVYQFISANKKMKIIDRINLMLGWIANRQYLVVNTCNEHIREFGTYSWTEKDIPEDTNDHTINASQYGWMPLQRYIGSSERPKANNVKNTIKALKQLGV